MLNFSYGKREGKRKNLRKTHCWLEMHGNFAMCERAPSTLFSLMNGKVFPSACFSERIKPQVADKKLHCVCWLE